MSSANSDSNSGTGDTTTTQSTSSGFKERRASQADEERKGQYRTELCDFGSGK